MCSANTSKRKQRYHLLAVILSVNTPFGNAQITSHKSRPITNQSEPITRHHFQPIANGQMSWYPRRPSVAVEAFLLFLRKSEDIHAVPLEETSGGYKNKS